MQLGTITLNISFCIYLIWFIPQITLNFKRKSTDGLSLLMHSILCLGYLCDLLYGFGQNMQWQYRMVTLIGLASLAIQHYQFARYGLKHIIEKRYYFAFSGLYCVFICYALFTLIFKNINKELYTIAGLLAHLCWFTYAMPQIIRNQTRKSAIGLSPVFVLFAIFLNICDMTSAWSLGWPYPSKIGPAFSLLLNMTLLLQIYGYRKFDGMGLSGKSNPLLN